MKISYVCEQLRQVIKQYEESISPRRFFLGELPEITRLRALLKKLDKLQQDDEMSHADAFEIAQIELAERNKMFGINPRLFAGDYLLECLDALKRCQMDTQTNFSAILNLI